MPRVSGRQPILEAEGFSEALNRIFAAARNIDDKTMALQYLRGAQGAGRQSATKYIIPLELTDLAKHLGGFLDSGLDTGERVRLGGSSEEGADDSAA